MLRDGQPSSPLPYDRTEKHPPLAPPDHGPGRGKDALLSNKQRKKIQGEGGTSAEAGGGQSGEREKNVPKERDQEDFREIFVQKVAHQRIHNKKEELDRRRPTLQEGTSRNVKTGIPAGTKIWEKKAEGDTRGRPPGVSRFSQREKKRVAESSQAGIPSFTKPPLKTAERAPWGGNFKKDRGKKGRAFSRQKRKSSLEKRANIETVKRVVPHKKPSYKEKGKAKEKEPLGQKEIKNSGKKISPGGNQKPPELKNHQPNRRLLCGKRAEKGVSVVKKSFSARPGPKKKRTFLGKRCL